MRWGITGEFSLPRVRNRVRFLACAILTVAALPAFSDEPRGPLAALRDRIGASESALFIMPVSGATLSSGFGQRTHPVLGVVRAHDGVDWSAPRGTSIVAVADGVVLSAGWDGDYGYTTRIMHAGNVETLYAHQSSLAPGLTAGSPVQQGQIIGAVGSTGLATGNHLHFEVLIDGRAVDPLGDELRRLGQRFDVARLR